MKVLIEYRQFDREEALKAARNSLERAYCDTRRKGLETIIERLTSGAEVIRCNISNINEDYPLNAFCDIFDKFDDEFVPAADAEMTLDYVLLSDKSITDMERKLFYARYKDKAKGKELCEVSGLSRERSRQIINRTLWKLHKAHNANILRKGIIQYVRELQTTVHENEAEIKELNNLLTRAQGKSEPAWIYKPPYSSGRGIEIRRTTEIGELDFSVRLFNCLAYAGIRTVGDLLDYHKEFGYIRHLGRKSFEELEAKCEEIGLPFHGVFYFSGKQVKV